MTKFRTPDEWHEDFGDVLWWRLPLTESPWVGSPLCDEWEQDYFTHWSPIIVPEQVTSEDVSIATGAVEYLRSTGHGMYADAVAKVLQLVKGE